MKKTLLFLSIIGLLTMSCERNRTNNKLINGCSGTLSDDIAISSNYEDVPWNEDINYGSVRDADGNEYRTVTIGDQEWMAENLKTTKYSNGEDIEPAYNYSNLLFDEEGELQINENRVAEAGSPAYAWMLEQEYDVNDETEVEIYGNVYDFRDCFGAYYNHYAVEDPRNICPVGWHVPSFSDWYELKRFLVDSTSIVELSAKTIDTKSFYGIGTYGTDKYGFRALPVGDVEGIELYDSGLRPSWWATGDGIYGGEEAYLGSIHGPLSDPTPQLNTSSDSKSRLKSVRCIKD